MAADQKNLLVELLVEELPPKALPSLGQSFAQVLSTRLQAQGLRTADSTVTSFASPRRLAAHFTQVAAVAPDREIVLKLMPKAVALDDAGRPTEALRKRLAKEGQISLADAWPNASDGADRLFVQNDGKTDAMYLRSLVSGASLAAGLQNALEEAIRGLPIPKMMSYQLADGWSTVNFVRPAHALVALHGDQVVNVSVLGLQADRTTCGHRFEATQSPITLKDADSYAQQLENEGAVIAGFAERRSDIVRQLQAAAAKEGLTPVHDEALLDEVTALVERPNVLVCQFEREFLDVPQECLVLTMKANQRYFPLLDAGEKLTNKFLVVSNVRPADPSRVIQGNERVVRPRLADAKFFFEQDRKLTLRSRITSLNKVVYHNKLGTVQDRVARIKELARGIAEELASQEATHELSAKRAEEAAELSKCDLLTSMVGEFPELQGVMGRYYALAEGVEAEIAEAIREQYLPKGAGDELPQTRAGMTLALADKLDTIAGVFAINQKPTGTRDPLGVRRAAIGVLRIVIERKLSLDLRALIGDALRLQPITANVGTADEIYDYVMERLRAYYLEGAAQLSISAEMFDAVLANRPASPLDFDARLRALASFLKLSDAQGLAAANKRISNILKKSALELNTAVRGELFREDAERALYKQLQTAEAETAPLFARGDYQGALTRLASLRTTVDRFFDDVMVMADDAAVRTNRLALLASLREQFLRVADLSRLPG